MMNHIDISTVLRQTVSCDLYSNLVTRPTGAAVRGQIEHLLNLGHDDGVDLTVIDFSHVAMIDFSCADEVIAKLLLNYAGDEPRREVYFVFRGLSEDHWAAIEAVLERHDLALVIDQGHRAEIVGVVSDDERRTWEMVYRLGRTDVDEMARELDADPVEVRRALEALWRRRLVMNVGGRYMAVCAAIAYGG